MHMLLHMSIITVVRTVFLCHGLSELESAEALVVLDPISFYREYTWMHSIKLSSQMFA